ILVYFNERYLIPPMSDCNIRLGDITSVFSINRSSFLEGFNIKYNNKPTPTVIPLSKSTVPYPCHIFNGISTGNLCIDNVTDFTINSLAAAGNNPNIKDRNDNIIGGIQRKNETLLCLFVLSICSLPINGL